MPGDVKTYDYQVLESCVAQMKNKVTQIEEQAANLASQTQQLMGTWTGSTAAAYGGMSTDLKAELDVCSQNLDRTRGALESGASNMQHTDASGSKSFA